MTSKQARLLETLQRVLRFLQTHAARMDRAVTSTAGLRFLAATRRMATLASMQAQCMSAVSSGTTNVRTLKKALTGKHLRPIAIVAGFNASVPTEVASAAAQWKMWHSHADRVAGARRVADAVRGHEQVFVEAGLAEGFVDQLVTAADCLEAAMIDKDAAIEQQMAATIELNRETRVVRHALRLLDALIRASAQMDGPLLTQWRTASRIDREAGNPGTTEGATVLKLLGGNTGRRNELN